MSIPTITINDTTLTPGDMPQVHVDLELYDALWAYRNDPKPKYVYLCNYVCHKEEKSAHALINQLNAYTLEESIFGKEVPLAEPTSIALRKFFIEHCVHIREYTTQEVVSKVVTALLAQDKRSAHPDASRMCLYRGTKGIKCAVGHLIPDNVYTTQIENLPIARLSNYLPRAFNAFIHAHEPLLDRLRDIHDSYSPEVWQDMFERVAEDYGVNMP